MAGTGAELLTYRQWGLNTDNTPTSMDDSIDVVQISALSEAFKGAITPLAESQKYIAQETTRQTEIISDAKLKMFWGVCVLVTLIIALAAFALYLNKDDITEKVLIAIVSFLGGLGFGKIGKGS